MLAESASLTTDIVEVGVDYLSMSMPEGAVNHAEWCNKAALFISSIGNEGNELRYGGFQGYEGWYCAGCFYGVRIDGAHIHLPGSYADRAFSTLYDREAHYSRLDIQSTVRFEPFSTELAEREESNANAANNQLPGNRRRLIRLIRDSNAGRTLYVGVRTSPVYCRLYNKEAKSTSDIYTHCWRYEVETHNQVATSTASRLINSGASICALIASLVWQTFKERGIEPPYTKQQESAALPTQVRQESDIDRKLNWLSTQVRPCVLKLAQAVNRDILMEALGLADTLPVEP